MFKNTFVKYSLIIKIKVKLQILSLIKKFQLTQFF